MAQERNYIFNLETTKIELHFEKAEYDQLPEDTKKNLKSAFLFSGKNKCWVSRAKEPNLWRAKDVAKKMGFVEEVREGERLSYAEQLERKAERAEDRAERFEQYAENAENRAVNLQKPLNDKHGDIAFFTQPIIAGHAGSQSFARCRERLYARYDRGFDEYRKSAYFRERADTAKDTANMEKLKDKGYLNRKIEEARKTIRNRRKNVTMYENVLQELEAGVKKVRYDRTPVTAAEIEESLFRELELIEVAQDKEGYFLNCMDNLGGVAYSRENIRVGYVVTIKSFGAVEVIGRGSKNINYKILTGGAAGMTGTAAYAEIKEVIKEQEAVKRVEKHPFTVGETFSASGMVYEIVKVSDTTIKLAKQGAEEKPIIRKPRKNYFGHWAFSIDDSFVGTFTKATI